MPKMRILEILAEWAARTPKVSRIRLNEAAEDRPLSISLELHPVTDSDETLTVWLANAARWKHELQSLTGRDVQLDCVTG